LGVDARRTLPVFTSRTFYSWFKNRQNDSFQKQGKQVLLLVDLFTNYHEPGVAIAAYNVLSSLGYNVLVPGIWPTGRPQLSKGFLKEAAHICTENINRFTPFADMDIPIIGLEPSEVLTLRDEYVDLCDEYDLKKTEEIASKSFLFEEFIYTELASEQPTDLGKNRRVYVHGHCHTKSLVGNDPLIQMFKQFGFDPVELQTGCCGMAGSFGYDRDKYEISMQVGEQVLFPALRELPDDALVCAAGFSCRHQIADGVQIKAKHPAEILAEVL
jgi:Fe-S oxidoreductase